MPHRAKLYYSLSQLLEYMTPKEDSSKEAQKRKDRIVRFWTARWKRHFARNGNVPLIVKCSICSGKERLHEIKSGKWKISTRGDKRYKEECE